MPEHGNLITLDEAALRLGLSRVTLRRYASEGKLSLYKVGARFVRLDSAEVDALVTAVPTAKAGA